MKRIAMALVAAALVAAAYAAPASAKVTFRGECTIDGVATFGTPLRLYPQDMDWGFTSKPGGGKCTGTLNDGPLVQDTPLDVVVSGHGPISCGVLGLSVRADFTGTFTGLPRGDNTLSGKLTLVAPAAQNILFIEGRNDGYATGRASFFGQNDQVAVLNGCIEGNTVRSLNVTVTVATPGIGG